MFAAGRVSGAMNELGPAIRVNEYDVVQLEEFKGNLDIVLGYEKRDGSFAPKWCKRNFGEEEKNVPVKVPMGDQAKAISVMTLWLAHWGYKVVKP